MSERKPAPLHLLALYVSYRMREALVEKGQAGDPHFDNRHQFEGIVFLAGEALRVGKPSVDLGLQTVFRAQGLNRLETVRTVLDQCEENNWLKKPPPASNEYNYSLTAMGRNLVQRLFGRDGPTNLLDFFLGEETWDRVDRAIFLWTGRPPWELQRELLEIAGRAYAEPTVVPHYDLSDAALRPYLEGYSSRSPQREPSNHRLRASNTELPKN